MLALFTTDNNNRQQCLPKKLTLQYYYYKMHQNSPKSHIFPRACWFAFLPVKVESRTLYGIVERILYCSLYFNAVNTTPSFRIQISFNCVEREIQMKKTRPLKFLRPLLRIQWLKMWACQGNLKGESGLFLTLC